MASALNNSFAKNFSATFGAFVTFGALGAGLLISNSGRASADDIMATKAPPIPYSSPGYNWNGFYLGGHIGGAFGTSNWSTPGVSGSSPIYQTINTFDEAGSFLAGIQGGYNYLLPNRVLIGGEADFTFPNFPSITGLSTGPNINFTSPAFGPMNFTEAMLSSGTVRGRIGYAPGNWLFYATGGFAWTYTQQTLTNLTTGNAESPFVWRLGWTVGGGVETPIAPHWTARLEYLFLDFGNKTYPYTAGVQPFTSNFLLQEVRAGVNYQFADPAPSSGGAFVAKAPALPNLDNVNFHGQATFVEQGTPAFRSPPGSTGGNSLQPVANGRETIDGTLYAGLRLWQGAELWVNPEIDQGHGLAETHGLAGFASGEAYKLGFSYPYARVQRYFVRQTIDLGGETQKIDADVNQFAMTTTENRLVLTVGKFGVVDLFDTNKYANNPKVDFLNWSLINAGTFDYAGDAWGYSYGAAAEWYQGRFTLRGGVFDMSAVPAETNNAVTPAAYGLDEGFNQQEFVGEIEERHELWGQPGKLKLTGFVIHGKMGNFQDAVAAAATPGNANFGDVNTALVADRMYRYRPGASLNLEQQINDSVGIFARLGWADGTVEPWDFTDIDRTAQVGASIAGKSWGRPDDTVGIAGVINGIAPSHIAYFNAGGIGILVGDGSLPNYGLEQILETYYSYAITPSLKASFDYQFIANPAYNANRGPVNVFAGRLHTQF
jgi:high affinity Mn2+ porin